MHVRFLENKKVQKTDRYIACNFLFGNFKVTQFFKKRSLTKLYASGKILFSKNCSALQMIYKIIKKVDNFCKLVNSKVLADFTEKF